MPQKKRIKKITAAARNWYLFHAVYCTNLKFNERVNQISNKWGLPLNNVEGNDLRNYLEKFDKIHGANSLPGLVNDINKLVYDFDLGTHWILPYLHFFLSEKELPIPHHSFLVSGTEGDSIKEKRIRLEIGPHTTLDDLKDIWPQIEKLKKKVWPKVKSEKISLKTLENYLIWAQDLNLRYSQKAVDQKIYDNATEVYQKEISKDEDIAGLIWPDEEDISLKADKKRTNKLRQIRKRAKKLIKE